MKSMIVSKLLVAMLVVVSLHAFAQTRKAVRGDVVGVDGHTLHVKSNGQVLDILLSDDARVSVRAPASLDAIRQGEFVGVTAKPGADGTLVASEVHIFPESRRGTGEGHYPMTGMPGSTMTNATVSRVSKAPARSRGSKTNATVASIGAEGSGRMLRLTYKGGEQNIFVPDATPVVRLESGTVASLTPGAHVIVNPTTNADGMLEASRVSVGKNGSVPPI
jgi:uncharacterized protein DUF5666